MQKSKEHIWETRELFRIRIYLPRSLSVCFFLIAFLLEGKRALWITEYMAR
jgi:hypothetical protein